MIAVATQPITTERRNPTLVGGTDSGHSVADDRHLPIYSPILLLQ